MTQTATCACGQLTLHVEGDPDGTGICHCLECQRRTGSVFAALATFSAAWTFDGRVTEYLRVGDQGGRFVFRFCPICGTTVFHTREGDDSVIWVAIGTLTDPNDHAPAVSIYEDRKHAWVETPRETTSFALAPSAYRGE